MTMISYAQNGEDVMLSRALRGVEHGFYIDVGAAWPTEHSVTRTFYDRGWRGINVEPTRRFFQALAAARPRDVNIPAALDEVPGEKIIFAFEGTGLSTLDPEVAEAHAPGGWTMTPTSVPTRTLAELCAEHAADTAIHFLKVDVEGAEARVLRGADFARFRPWIVLVEATRPLSPEPNYESWEPILTGAGYEFAWFDGLNRFYLAAEKAEELRGHFRVPINFFDDFVLYNPDTERERARAAVAVAAAVADADQARSTVQATREAAEAELDRARQAVRAAEAAAKAAREDAEAARRRAGELAAEAGELRCSGREPAPDVRYGDGGSRVAELEARLSAFEQPQAAAEPDAAGRARPRGVRGLAFALYRVTLRPFVRPAIWRIRTFLLGGLQHEQRVLSGQQREVTAQLASRLAELRQALSAADDRQREAAAQVAARLVELRQEQLVLSDRQREVTAQLPARLTELQGGLVELSHRQRELTEQLAARLGELQHRLDGTVGFLTGVVARPAPAPVVHVEPVVVPDPGLADLARSMESALMALAVTAARTGNDAVDNPP